jgi:hypothetical protein
MTMPHRHLRAVADPAPDVVGAPQDHEEPPADEPPTGLLADALACVVDDEQPEAPVLAGPGLTDADALLAGRREPDNPFLEMVERAEKISPLRGGRERMDPLELLRMIGGSPQRHPGGVDPEERSASIKRLVAAAWDVIRCGAVDDEPELRRCLVDVCTHLVESDPGCGGAS